MIPAGARVLGSASPVQTWGDSRLAVSFHRLVMPDGRTYSLDRFKGLDQIGDTGLKDSVNRHYLQVFGASLAIGALSGLAQYGTRSSVDAYSFGDAYRQAAGSSLAASAGRVLDRYLNVLPTITIREGYRIKVYLARPTEPSTGQNHYVLLGPYIRETLRFLIDVLGRMEEHQYKKTSRLRKLRVSDANGSRSPRAGAGRT